MWIVIPTRDRRDELTGLLEDLQAHQVVLVDTADNAWADELVHSRVMVPRDPPNISRWWNAGLGAVACQVESSEPYEVAILNDDVRVPPGTLEELARQLRLHGAAAAFPDVHSTLPAGTVRLLRRAEPHNLFHRMTGYAFVLRGELGLRADERLAWWYGDDDLEWRAANLGGVVCVGGTSVDHRHPGESTNADSALGEQAGRDRATFTEKWDRAPW